MKRRGVYSGGRKLSIAGVLLATGTLLALSLAAAPSPGLAFDPACGGPQVFSPEKNANYGRAPIAIGDSPMLLALPELADRGFLANARGCRQYPEGVKLVQKYRHDEQLGRVVVVALGSNGSVTPENVHDALRAAGKNQILVLATPRELGGGSSSDATVIREEAREHRRIRLLDWVRNSAGQGGWFQPDGLHLTETGAEAMADFYADLVFRILKKPAK